MFWERKSSLDDLICPAYITVYRRREFPAIQTACPERGSEAADIDRIPCRRLLTEVSRDDRPLRPGRRQPGNGLPHGFKRHLIRQVKARINEKRRIQPDKSRKKE